MRVFSLYANYYDLLYRDKNYELESQYTLRLLNQYAAGVDAMLELGCGTGEHAAYMARAGITVHGIDQSKEMLNIAEQKLMALPEEQRRKLQFSHGDVRNISLNKIFDCVISLFHVVSYQTDNSDIISMMQTAKRHLRPDGLFLFDCWYGPAVLTERPASRTKYFDDDRISVVREAVPLLDPNKNIVDVRFDISITDKQTGSVHKLQETHRMRYYFYPELELIARQCGFTLLHAEEWLTGNKPGLDTWGVCFVLRG